MCEHGANRDEYISLAKAAEEIPGQPHVMSVRRWWSDGLKGNGGQIHLQTVKVAGRRFTTRRWLGEFFDQLRQTDGK